MTRPPGRAIRRALVPIALFYVLSLGGLLWRHRDVDALGRDELWRHLRPAGAPPDRDGDTPPRRGKGKAADGGARPRRGEATVEGARPRRGKATGGDAQPRRRKAADGGASPRRGKAADGHGGAQPHRGTAANGDADPAEAGRPRTPRLDCVAHGGPADPRAAAEMAYWKEIPEDSAYRSRFDATGPGPGPASVEDRFLTVDTDMSGFNNQRLVFETNVLTALVTGRVLVLPRDRAVTHLERGGRRFGMADVFDLAGVAARVPALRLMAFNAFAAREGYGRLGLPRDFVGFQARMTAEGRLVTTPHGTYEVNVTGASYPDAFLLRHLNGSQVTQPGRLSCDVPTRGHAACRNYTAWIDARHAVTGEVLNASVSYYRYFVDEYLSGHPDVFCPAWGSQRALLAIPNRTDDRVGGAPGAATAHYVRAGRPANGTTDATARQSRFAAWTRGLGPGPGRFRTRYRQHVARPTPVDAPPRERLAEVWQRREGLAVYDADLHRRRYYHMGDDVDESRRLMAPWYAYLFFEDWREDLWAKRFVRDRLRYRDELQCAAARIVGTLRKRARKQGGDGRFHSMHVRRGDLLRAYKDTARNASEIFAEFTTQRNIIPADSVVYIATDETKRSFFDVFKANYRAVYFLHNFKPLLGPDIPPEYHGMIDQLVASKGDHFIGTYYSTFTGYINRLRGYHSQVTTALRDDDDGRAARRHGRIPSWHYVPAARKDVYEGYVPVHRYLWAMEYTAAWRNIDYDVDPVLRAAIAQDAASR